MVSQYYLNKIQVKNFRNLTDKVIEFNKTINCIFGDNGNGKTNLLEVIHFLSHKKSFRKNTTFSQIINVECENPEIIFQSVFEKEEKLLSFSGKMDTNGSSWYLDNRLTKKKVDFKSIFINPFDSYMFHTIPSFRRNWFDLHLGMISPKYKTALNKYTQSLRFRNNLLSKKPENHKEQILAINIQMAEHSITILNEREEFLKSLKYYTNITFKLLFDEVHNLEIELESKFKNCSLDQIKNYYDESIEKDLLIGHTRSGVHKDDYAFHFDGYLSYDYCSLGQQKMSFLSLIFAYIELFRYKYGSYPMVLIDDVSGELDERRWQNLIQYLEAKSFQVLITTANDNFKKELEKITEAKKFYISNGEIQTI